MDLFPSSGDDILVGEALGPEDITKMLGILGGGPVRSLEKPKGKPNQPQIRP